MNRSWLLGLLMAIAAGAAACRDDELPPPPDAAVPVMDAAVGAESSLPDSSVAGDAAAPADTAVGADAWRVSVDAQGTDSYGAGGATFRVVATFTEPKTQPNDTIFTGIFTFDPVDRTVTGLAGSLTQAMTKVNGTYGAPMTTVALTHQLSSVPLTVDGVDGLLVTTFALDATDTFTGGGFAPGGTQYYGLNEATPNNHNAYVSIFVNAADPTAALTQAQLEKLAYADCTEGGMMMKTCMTGTSIAGYGREGTMGGYPSAQTIGAP